MVASLGAKARPCPRFAAHGHDRFRLLRQGSDLIRDSRCASTGTTCEGEPYPELPALRLASCARQPIDPVTVCCQRDLSAGQRARHCEEASVDDSGSLATFVVLECTGTGEAEAIVGTCAADGHCIPRR